MGPLKVIIFIAVTFLLSAVTAFGSCPPKNKVTNAKPVCHSDADCQKWGQICCPNQFNTKSCTHRAPWRRYSPQSAKQPKLIRKGRACFPSGVWRNFVEPKLDQQVGPKDQNTESFFTRLFKNYRL